MSVLHLIFVNMKVYSIALREHRANKSTGQLFENTPRDV